MHTHTHTHTRSHFSFFLSLVLFENREHILNAKNQKKKIVSYDNDSVYLIHIYNLAHESFVSIVSWLKIQKLNVSNSNFKVQNIYGKKEEEEERKKRTHKSLLNDESCASLNRISLKTSRL